MMQFNGAEHLDELNAVLRHVCLIRRRREDVLDLPDFVRGVHILGELPKEALEKKLERFKWLRSEETAQKARADKE